MQTTDQAPSATLTTAQVAAIRKRLDRWELDHLRLHAAQLATELESAKERMESLESEVSSAWSMADMWRDEVNGLAEDLQAAGKTVGMTLDGQLGVVVATQQGAAATSQATTEAQATALARRARIGLAYAAECNSEECFYFWRGYGAAAEDILSGKSADMTLNDAALANEPQTRHEAAGAALPESTKNLTLAQVRQILATQGSEIATDTVAHADVGAGEVFKHNVVPAVNGNDEHASTGVDVRDGSGAHGLFSTGETAIVAQQGPAA